MKSIDPLVLLLRYLVLNKFYKTNLAPEERNFLEDNIDKHRKVLWINFLGILIIVIALLNSSSETIIALISALIAPAMLTGTAWFAVSFGGVPAKLITVAMSVTFWMFVAFTLSLSAMFVGVAFISPLILIPLLVVIYIGIIISCIQYDCADGLKAGLDEALLNHSRAALIYYKKKGIEPEMLNQKKPTKSIKNPL